MSERPSHNLEGLDLDLARRVDVICRRFEADWREGRPELVDDYLGEVPEGAQAALRAELQALQHELQRTEGPGLEPATGAGRPRWTVAEAPTIPPREPLGVPTPSEAVPSLHDEPTRPPREGSTVDLTPYPSAASGAPTPSSIRYFGDYEIIREIARGGMGVVFHARQMSLNRPVALKMILAGQLADETDVKRFYTEAEAAANLDHPGIVPIYEVGQHERQHYFSMGFVEGQSLSQRLAAGPLPPREAAALLVKVAEAIEYAHQRGVIHRDLKPGNILLDHNGNPRVTDFGLAKKLHGDSGLTGSGQIMGTPSYMPPEQAGGKRGEVGPPADIYALGATLYALVTGRPPFQAATAMDTVLQVLSEEPVPPRRLNPELGRDLETICLKCLEKDPGKRYISAAALGGDLQHYLAGEPILARPVGTAERQWRWCRRNPVMAGLAGAVALSLVAGTVVSTLLAMRANRDATAARERLWGSLLAQGRAERLNGARWSAIEAIGEAAKIQRSEHLRQLAIETIVAPGVRLQRTIAFGAAYVVRFSPDGALLAIQGFQHGDPGDQGKPHPRIVVYRVADGREVDRIEQTNDPPSGLLAFRPGSSILAYWDNRKPPSIMTFRDVVRRQDVASLPGVEPSKIVFSPDGEKLALRKDFALRIYEADGLREERSRQTANGPYGFLANDELLIEEAGSLRGWNVRTGRDSYTFPIPQGKTFHLQNSSGPAVVLVDKTPVQTVSLWDVRTGKEVARLDDAIAGQWGFGLRLTAPCPFLAFNVRSRRGEILLYDVVRRVPRSRIFGVVEAQGNFNSEQLSSLSPDGRLLAAYARVNGGTGPNTIQIWDVETGQKVASLGDCIKPLWSPDGRRLVAVAPGKVADLVGLEIVAGGSDALVKVWQVADPSPAYRQEQPVTAISSTADGCRLAIMNQLWEVDRGPGRVWLKPMPSLGPADLIAGTASGALYAGEWQRPELLKQFGVGQPNQGALPKQFERPISLRQLEPHARQIALTAFERLDGTSYYNDARQVAFSPDGRLAAVSWERFAKDDRFRGTVGEQIDLWDLTTPNRLRVFCKNWTSPEKMTISFRYDARQLVFSSDSRYLAIAFYGGVGIFGVADGKLVRWLVSTVQPKPDYTLVIQPHCVAFSPDGQFLYIGGEEGRVSIATVKPITGEPIDESAFAPNDAAWSRFAAARPRATWNGHEGTVLAVSVSADGRTLASGGADRMIRLWEMPTGRALAHWEAHDAEITALAFLADRRTLVSGAADGLIKLWDLSSIRGELAAIDLDW